MTTSQKCQESIGDISYWWKCNLLWLFQRILNKVGNYGFHWSRSDNSTGTTILWLFFSSLFIKPLAITVKHKI